MNLGSETANRVRRARLLAVVLAEHGATAAQVVEMPEAGWRMAAQLAHITRPSEETRRVVVAVLAQHEERGTKPTVDVVL